MILSVLGSGHLPEKPYLKQASCPYRWGHPTKTSASNQCQLHLRKMSCISFPYLTLPGTVEFKITRRTQRIILWNSIAVKLGSEVGTSGAFVKLLTLHKQFDNSSMPGGTIPLALCIWVNLPWGELFHTPSSQRNKCLSNSGGCQSLASSQ